MGYRQHEPRPKPVRRTFNDTTTRNCTFVQNGALAQVAIPCWYLDYPRPAHAHLHDRDHHDHLGWPDPGHPDESCQSVYHLHSRYDHCAPHLYDTEHQGWLHATRYLDFSKVFPIHLRKEGYSNVSVAFTDKPSGLSATGVIPQVGALDDHVIRIEFDVNVPTAVKQDVDVPYVVFLNGNVGGRSTRDIAAKGVLHIVAGPIS